MEEKPLDTGLQISMSSDDMEEDLQSNRPFEGSIVNGLFDEQNPSRNDYLVEEVSSA
ncbi:hypothetical protein RchiOBHm_Chr3g0464811 [Rosa chinensis]|uniref:Uncharacterized protein n=1 Tax=Rosa chinensis TaxID=74649 RepID=A0A2P6R9M0_ROSCH|nr:hypothetical protein RchiOBHm_Chr3g0464811 [Rosa chinensis]